MFDFYQISGYIIGINAYLLAKLKMIDRKFNLPPGVHAK